ncbi:MAG: substrate-binding domain-containing protein [Capsulimonadaceae bacterium]|nr:substrate-binding domain-containing protein [Capsulimonadaceae bacterium]
MKTTSIQMGSRGHSLAAHVEDVLRGRVREGIYPPGSLLPGRRLLCAELDIAPTTLDKAIKSLLSDGTLRAEARRGTFVADTLPPADRRSNSVRPAARRINDGGGARIGIVSADNDLFNMDPVQALFDYMTVHAVEDRVSSLGGGLLYRAWQPRQYDPAYLLDGAADEFVRLGANAFVILALHQRFDAADREIKLAEQLGLPTVVVSASAREWATSHVWTDNRLAGRLAMEHLLEAGHRHVVFLAPYDAWWEDERILGARDAMRQAGLSEEDLIVIRDDRRLDDFLDHKPAIDAGELLAVNAHRQGVPFTALLAANDWLAAGAIQGLKAVGLCAGEDYAVVGFDDQAIARQHQISSFRFPLDQLGAEAAELAVRAVGGERLQHRLRIAGQVVTRRSSTRPANQLVH